MRRRDFITLFGGMATWPLVARAQQGKVPVVGFLCSTSRDKVEHLVEGFRQGLQNQGYIDGQNVNLEYRFAEGHYDLLPRQAEDLINRGVAVIAAVGGPAPAIAAKKATEKIPIVFTMASDPMKYGLVASLNRPGGNVTGIFAISSALEGKRIGLLHALLPDAPALVAFVNPTNPAAESQIRDLQIAAQDIGRPVHVTKAHDRNELETGFAEGRKIASAALVTADFFYASERNYIVEIASKYNLPTIYEYREFAQAGGLMSYGPSQPGVWREAGTYVGRILKGTRPAELPVEQPARFELVINLKTAGALGIVPPPTFLALTDEVIE
jgi:putative ABC transport system substrate-binding protein